MWTQQWLATFFVLLSHMNQASFQNSGFKCTAPGFFADPLDCHNFFYCNSDLSFVRGTCTKYGYFDPVETCVWGDCTTPIVTTAAPKEEFKCTAAGYYPDPYNCRKYYLCSSALVANSGICMGGAGYFNKDTLGCETGDC